MLGVTRRIHEGRPVLYADGDFDPFAAHLGTDLGDAEQDRGLGSPGRIGPRCDDV